jgi:hypothetical protein
MLEIRPIQEGDLELIRQNPLEEAVKKYPDWKTPENNAWSALWNGKLIAVGGMIILWEGVGEAWLMLSKDFNGMSNIAVLLGLRKQLNKMVEDNKLWRVQAMVRPDVPKAVEMIEYFGFEKEGLLKKYCPDGGDAYVYSKII